MHSRFPLENSNLTHKVASSLNNAEAPPLCHGGVYGSLVQIDSGGWPVVMAPAGPQKLTFSWATVFYSLMLGDVIQGSSLLPPKEGERKRGLQMVQRHQPIEAALPSLRSVSCNLYGLSFFPEYFPISHNVLSSSMFHFIFQLFS